MKLNSGSYSSQHAVKSLEPQQSGSGMQAPNHLKDQKNWTWASWPLDKMTVIWQQRKLRTSRTRGAAELTNVITFQEKALADIKRNGASIDSRLLIN